MRKVTWIERPEIYLRGHRCYGIANHDDWSIEIDTPHHRSPRQVLNTEIHELHHLINPQASERQTNRAANFLCAELWKLGYRKVK